VVVGLDKMAVSKKEFTKPKKDFAKDREKKEVSLPVESHYKEGDKCPYCPGKIVLIQEDMAGWYMLMCNNCMCDATELEKV
jgi:hypothetical protein